MISIELVFAPNACGPTASGTSKKALAADGLASGDKCNPDAPGLDAVVLGDMFACPIRGSCHECALSVITAGVVTCAPPPKRCGYLLATNLHFPCFANEQRAPLGHTWPMTQSSPRKQRDPKQDRYVNGQYQPILRGSPLLTNGQGQFFAASRREFICSGDNT